MQKIRRSALCGCVLMTVSQAHGQDAETPAAPEPSPAPSTDTHAADVEELKARTDKMERDVEALRAELEEERRERRNEREKLAQEQEKERQSAEAKKAAPEPKNLSEQSSSVTSHETMRGDHHASPRPGNAPLDPAYQGFIPLFEGKTWVKFGGYAKLDAMVDTTRLGNPNKFVTASIPVEGDAEFGSPEQFNMLAKQSRLSFEVRSPTPLGSVRFVYENDFYGNGAAPGMDYNLRHLYIQVANLTLGQTWTTFLDPDTIPDTLDFAGPGVQAVLRQPLVRYTFSPVKDNLHIAIAAEAPTSDLTLPLGSEARRLAPDVVTNVRLEGGLGHLQVGAVGRVLAYDNGGADGGDSAFGYGVSASGKLNVGEKDSLLGTVAYGDGVGRYMQDLGASLAGYVDADGEVQTTAAFGFFAGYRHFWIKNLSSQVTYGYLDVDSSDLGATAYKRTHYGQGNLVWSPIPALSLGGELLYGHKTTQDESEGDAFRGMFSIKYKLN